MHDDHALVDQGGRLVEVHSVLNLLTEVGAEESEEFSHTEAAPTTTKTHAFVRVDLCVCVCVCACARVCACVRVYVCGWSKTSCQVAVVVMPVEATPWALTTCMNYPLGSNYMYESPPGL